MNSVQIIIVIFVLYVLCSIVINLTLMSKDLWDTVNLTINLPKPKRYSIKVSPIYKLALTEYLESGFEIQKWDLDYVTKESLQFWLIFLMPYPLEIKFWKYRKIETIFIGGEETVREMKGSLEELFESVWAIKNATLIEEERIRKEKWDKIRTLNEVFNANFEK